MSIYEFHVQQAIRYVLYQPMFSDMSPVDAPLKDRLVETAARFGNVGRLMAHVADALDAGLDGVVNKSLGPFTSTMLIWKALSEHGVEPVSFFSMFAARPWNKIGVELVLKKSEVEDDEHEAFKYFKSKVFSADEILKRYRHPQDGAIITPSDALRSHEAKLYNLFAQNPDNAGYLAVSKLMKDCHDWWLSEMPDMPDYYLEKMRNVFHRSLAYYPKTQVAAQMVDALHHYFMTQAMAFAAHPVAENQAFFSWQNHDVRPEGLAHLCFDEERSVTLAACALISGSLEGAARVLEPLIQTPDSFAQALRSANQSPDQAQFLLKVCLYNQLMNEAIPLSSITPWLEDMRAAFVGYSLGDIVRTQALDALTCNVSAGELAEQQGYLRTEPMNMTYGFAARMNSTVQQSTLEGTDEHYARAMHLALRLEQLALINEAAKHFFSEICKVQWPLCQEAAQQVFVRSEHFNPVLVIKDANAAEKAFSLGADRQNFLQHPAMQVYAATALELDLGL